MHGHELQTKMRAEEATRCVRMRSNKPISITNLLTTDYSSLPNGTQVLLLPNLDALAVSS